MVLSEFGPEVDIFLESIYLSDKGHEQAVMLMVETQ
jgi:hypothetical protein